MRKLITAMLAFATALTLGGSAFSQGRGLSVVRDAEIESSIRRMAESVFGVAGISRSAILGWSGVLVGAYPLAWQLSGQFSPSTHSMPLIVFPQAVWMIAAAMVMVRAAKAGDR